MWLFVSILGGWVTISLLLALIVGPLLEHRGKMTSEIDASDHAAHLRAREAA
jgi:hypothetical protein